MARDGTIELPWPDAARVYRLRLGELRQLQEKCDAGPLEILARMQAGRWRVDDIYQTIRLGLIGGGMRMDEALRIVDLTIHDGVLGECLLYAIATLNAAITGPPDETIDRPREKRATGTEKMKPDAANSNGRRSTPKPRSSDGRRRKSRK